MKSFFIRYKRILFYFQRSFIYKQKDGVAISFPQGQTLAHAFLCFYERKWLEKNPLEFKPVFYGRYVVDIFVLFKHGVIILN